MKFNKIAVLTASVLLSTSVMAQDTLIQELIKPEVKKVTQKVTFQADFGSYIVERELAYIPSSIADTDTVISTKGSMSVVKASAPVELVTKGTLVKNILTNELATLSGNISVLLEDGASADELSVKTGLAIVSVYEGTKIAIFKVTGTQDIMEAKNQLKASGLVKVAKIEVLDSIYVAH